MTKGIHSVAHGEDGFLYLGVPPYSASEARVAAIEPTQRYNIPCFQLFRFNMPGFKMRWLPSLFFFLSRTTKHRAHGPSFTGGLVWD